MCVCVCKIFIRDNRCFAHRNYIREALPFKISKFCKIQRTAGRPVGDNLDVCGEKKKEERHANEKRNRGKRRKGEGEKKRTRENIGRVLCYARTPFESSREEKSPRG